MSTSCLSRKHAQFVYFLVFLVPPIDGNDRKNTKQSFTEQME